MTATLTFVAGRIYRLVMWGDAAAEEGSDALMRLWGDEDGWLLLWGDEAP